MIRGSCCARFRRSRGRPARLCHRWSPSSCGHPLLHSVGAVDLLPIGKVYLLFLRSIVVFILTYVFVIMTNYEDWGAPAIELMGGRGLVPDQDCPNKYSPDSRLASVGVRGAAGVRFL